MADENNVTTTDIDLIDDNAEDMELAEVTERANELIKNIRAADNPWGITSRAKQSVRLAMTSLSTKNGMYARVPLVCKADECPYADQCQLLPYDMAPEGEYCAVELAQINLRAMGYSQDIDYDSSSFTDKNLVSELITLDIMLERCKALMTKDGTPVIDMAIGVDQDGNEIRQPAVSKAWEAYEKISKKRDSTYKMLMMTRDSQKGKDEDSDGKSVSDMIQDVINSTSTNS